MRRVQNPPNRFDAVDLEWLEAAPEARLEILDDDTRTILSENTSPDLDFRWSVNPYRGCFHACAYCYARPTHEYLGLGAGTDFDSKIYVKRRAAELLRRAFLAPAWRGELIVFSGNTDCYQPLESSLQLTRDCLRVCAEFRNPVGIVTKSILVQRDLDVLSVLQRDASVCVFFSIPFADDAMGRAIEPQTPLVSRRFEALRRVSDAGIPTGVSIAPLIPGLNEEDVPRILERARDCGAYYAQQVLLRLPGSSSHVFLERLRATLPRRAARVERRILDVRSGTLHEGRFFARGQGQGTYWDMIQKQWQVHTRRLGFANGRHRDVPVESTSFCRPSIQPSLFDATD